MLLFCISPPHVQAAPSPALAVIRRFEADRREIHVGETFELSWEATGVETLRLEPLGVRQPPCGTLRLSLTESTTFWLSAVNLAGGEMRPLVIRVLPGAPAVQTPALVVATESPKSEASSRTPGRSVVEALWGKPAVRSIKLESSRKNFALPSPAPEPARALDRTQGGQTWWIQFSAVTTRTAAEALVDELSRRFGTPFVIQEAPYHRNPGQTIFRVRSGPFRKREAARRQLQSWTSQLRETQYAPVVMSP
jgi:hypothetical protein